jgi:hypothetical protein
MLTPNLSSQNHKMTGRKTALARHPTRHAAGGAYHTLPREIMKKAALSKAAACEIVRGMNLLP